MIPNPITDREHADRIAALRAALDREGLDAVILYGAHRDYQPADLRYFARWYCVEEETAALFVPREGPTVLLTDAGWDIDRAKAEAYADEMRLTRDMGADLAGLVHEHAGGSATPGVGIAGYAYFPAPAYLKLVERIPDGRFRDASPVTGALRMVKSHAELDLMRAASQISDAAMAAGLAEIRPGATEIDVAAAAEEVIRRAGAEPSFVTEMGAGPRTALGTFLPGGRTLTAGSSPCSTAAPGCTDITATCAGRWWWAVPAPNRWPSSRPSRTPSRRRSPRSGQVSPWARSVTSPPARSHAPAYAENRWDAFMPHGNGAGQHEAPNAKEHPDQPLLEGMVLCIEPGSRSPTREP